MVFKGNNKSFAWEYTLMHPFEQNTMYRLAYSSGQLRGSEYGGPSRIPFIEAYPYIPIV